MGEIEVCFGTRWQPADDLVFDWRIANDMLHLVLDRTLLQVQRRIVSVTTARWRIDGVVYRTSTTMEGGGAFRIVARREERGT